MKSSNKHIINIFATGFFVLVFLSILLFWARWTPEAIFQSNASIIHSVRLKPSGLVPAEVNDPNVEQYSSIVRTYTSDWAMYSLGAFRDIETQPAASRQFGVMSIYLDYLAKKHERKGESIWNVLYFDKKIGLFVYCNIFRQAQAEKTKWVRKIHLYAGPEGISESPDEGLGRFIKPLESRRRGGNPNSFIIFDKGLSRFFRIKFKEQKVTKGPEVPEGHRPVQIEKLVKNSEVLGRLNWLPPLRKATPQEERDRTRVKTTTRDKNRNLVRYVTVDEYMYTRDSEKYILVLDRSGRIDRLDAETLEFAGAAGYLPAAPTFFRSKRSVTPKDLLSYRVLSLASKDGEHKGMFVASVFREANGLALAVFDEKGDLINKSTSKQVLLETPWGPALMIAKYLAENLQPPVLSIISYFTAESFEAADGHRALFVLPNSFIAMFGRKTGGATIGGFFAALFLISPSIILGVLLAWHLRIDATIVGLSKRAKLYWTIGTIAFGLSAYITYRLTRPKIILVTCVNCGRLRRPDMTRCHRCGSKWHVPELIPPTWRVID